jgi:hypothetical protein
MASLNQTLKKVKPPFLHLFSRRVLLRELILRKLNEIEVSLTDRKAVKVGN